MMFKVKHVVRTAAEVMKMGKCVVIGLQSTGEARTIEAVEREEELTDFVSTSKGVLQASVARAARVRVVRGPRLCELGVHSASRAPARAALPRGEAQPALGEVARRWSVS